MMCRRCVNSHHDNEERPCTNIVGLSTSMSASEIESSAAEAQLAADRKIKKQPKPTVVGYFEFLFRLTEPKIMPKAIPMPTPRAMLCNATPSPAPKAMPIASPMPM
jgi:hypothetical protein